MKNSKTYNRLVQPREFRHKDIHLVGVSNAGVGTSIIWPDLKLCFDVAQGLPFSFNARKYLISHIHMDHAGGLPYVISQKSLTGQQPPDVFLPPSAVPIIDKILKTWSEAENHYYDYNLVPVIKDQKYEINNNHAFQIFPTFHRVESFGYTIFRRHHKLKPDLVGLDQEELIRRSQSGESINEEIYDPLFSFSGDTTIEFLDGPDFITKSQVLMLEVTFIDDKKSIQSARKWGHIHLQELAAQINNIQSEKIILIHFSMRYQRAEIQKRIEELFSPEDCQRLVIW